MRLVAAFFVVASLAGLLLWRKESARTAEALSEVRRLHASEADLKAQLAQALAHAAVGSESRVPEPPPAPVKSRERAIIREDTATRNELVRLLDEKQARLAALQKSLDEVEARLSESEAKLAAMTAEQQKFGAAERDLKDRLDTANRLAEALEAEVKGRSDRMLRIDSANRELQKRVDDAARKLERMNKAMSAAEDISRRREVYLTNLLRRYREVTDSYRTLAVRVNNPRDSALPAAGTDLSRIQNAIMLAEEDMRQLQTLNAQSSKLQKEMSAAAR
jgi:chromosome segregation ATPase